MGRKANKAEILERLRGEQIEVLKAVFQLRTNILHEDLLDLIEGLGGKIRRHRDGAWNATVPIEHTVESKQRVLSTDTFRVHVPEDTVEDFRFIVQEMGISPADLD